MGKKLSKLVKRNSATVAPLQAKVAPLQLHEPVEGLYSEKKSSTPDSELASITESDSELENFSEVQLQIAVEHETLEHLDQHAVSGLEIGDSHHSVAVAVHSDGSFSPIQEEAAARKAKVNGAHSAPCIINETEKPVSIRATVSADQETSHESASSDVKKHGAMDITHSKLEFGPQEHFEASEHNMPSEKIAYNRNPTPCATGGDYHDNYEKELELLDVTRDDAAGIESDEEIEPKPNWGQDISGYMAVSPKLIKTGDGKLVTMQDITPECLDVFVEDIITEDSLQEMQEKVLDSGDLPVNLSLNVVGKALHRAPTGIEKQNLRSEEILNSLRKVHLVPEVGSKSLGGQSWSLNVIKKSEHKNKPSPLEKQPTMLPPSEKLNQSEYLGLNCSELSKPVLRPIESEKASHTRLPSLHNTSKLPALTLVRKPSFDDKLIPMRWDQAQIHPDENDTEKPKPIENKKSNSETGRVSRIKSASKNGRPRVVAVSSMSDIGENDCTPSTSSTDNRLSSSTEKQSEWQENIRQRIEAKQTAAAFKRKQQMEANQERLKQQRLNISKVRDRRSHGSIQSSCSLSPVPEAQEKEGDTMTKSLDNFGQWQCESITGILSSTSYSSATPLTSVETPSTANIVHELSETPSTRKILVNGLHMSPNNKDRIGDSISLHDSKEYRPENTSKENLFDPHQEGIPIELNSVSSNSDIEHIYL